ncbi:hypothetical protein JCM10207_005403 [Rhodosporidiobolus poonsookiae]
MSSRDATSPRRRPASPALAASRGALSLASFPPPLLLSSFTSCRPLARFLLLFISLTRVLHLTPTRQPLSPSLNAQQLHGLTTLTKAAAIDDVFTSEDSEKPISGGFFTVSAEGEPFVYTYKYDELKLIVEGTIVLEDKEAGIKIEGHPGDVINIKKGTTVTFTSPNFGKAFYVGQRLLRDF